VLSAAAVIGWRFGVRTAASQRRPRLKTLRAIARSSSSLFKKDPRNPSDTGRQLHVSHLLETSVERSGGRVNVVGSLVRTSDDKRIWTNAYIPRPGCRSRHHRDRVGARGYSAGFFPIMV
jgi:hypothetical protein